MEMCHPINRNRVELLDEFKKKKRRLRHLKEIAIEAEKYDTGPNEPAVFQLPKIQRDAPAVEINFLDDYLIKQRGVSKDQLVNRLTDTSYLLKSTEFAQEPKISYPSASKSKATVSNNANSREIDELLLPRFNGKFHILAENSEKDLTITLSPRVDMSQADKVSKQEKDEEISLTRHIESTPDITLKSKPSHIFQTQNPNN